MAVWDVVTKNWTLLSAEILLCETKMSTNSNHQTSRARDERQISKFRMFHPSDISSPDISPLVYSPPGRFTPRTFWPPDVSPTERFIPQKFQPMNILTPRTFYPSEVSTLGRFTPRKFQPRELRLGSRIFATWNFRRMEIFRVEISPPVIFAAENYTPNQEKNVAFWLQ